MNTFWLVLSMVLVIGSLLTLIGGAMYAWLDLSHRRAAKFRIDAERERVAFAIHQQMMHGLNEMLETSRNERGQQ